ncbi:MAG: lytic transglycosylase domain-containing protein [Pseudomonadota bacterium]
MHRLLVLATALLIALPATGSQGDRRPTAAICDAAARAASARHGVPLEVLRALTRTETGRPVNGTLQPWPWTLNMEGAGHWFKTRGEALKFALTRHAKGARSFDVGCFQINFRWHGQAFDSIETMFDQTLNADYAARFLKALKAEGGDWTTAVGKYHSRTPELALKYTARFERIFANLAPAASDLPQPQPKPSDTPPEMLIAGLGVRLSAPRHARTPGAVALTVFTGGKNLLTRAKPLFEQAPTR